MDICYYTSVDENQQPNHLMSNYQLIAQLHRQHQLLQELLASIPEADATTQYSPYLQSLAWYFGYSVTQELALFRKEVQGDDDLYNRVAAIFDPGLYNGGEPPGNLAPHKHLLNWASEVFEEDITALANPKYLPDHPLLKNDWLVSMLNQIHARTYEQMLLVLQARSIALHKGNYNTDKPLYAARPVLNAVAVNKGYFRIGPSRGVAFDDEQPRQITQLDSFRINRFLVTNASYLSFILDTGQEHTPIHWRRDGHDNWYAIGLNGAIVLEAADPVYGISQRDAQAYGIWVQAQGEEFTGAALQHEFQWEVAAKLGLLEDIGRYREWCWNHYSPYIGYEVPEPSVLASRFDNNQVLMRGWSMHTQVSLQRHSLRWHSDPDNKHSFCGLRLIYPSLPGVWQ